MNAVVKRITNSASISHDNNQILDNRLQRKKVYIISNATLSHGNAAKSGARVQTAMNECSSLPMLRVTQCLDVSKTSCPVDAFSFLLLLFRGDHVAGHEVTCLSL